MSGGVDQVRREKAPRVLASTGRWLGAFGLLCSLTASCFGPARRPGEPLDPVETRLAAFPDVRAVDGYKSKVLFDSFTAGMRERVRRWRAVGGQGQLPYDMLALSAGGPNGAFGAGVLCGWGQRPDRPEFDLVTGVSVGALMAPFAFLGPRYDEQLKSLFSDLSADDILVARGTLAAIFEESTLDSSPLRDRIDRHVDLAMIEDLAAAHEAGRRLYVGTTQLDSAEFVIWDIGAIAVRRTPDARDLVRSVLCASAAIPLLFPPVLFDVVDGSGRETDELHVDGAVVRPTFLPNQTFDGAAVARAVGYRWTDTRNRIFVIVNGALRRRLSLVQRDALDIGVQAVGAMMQKLLRDEIVNLFVIGRAWDAEFSLVSLPRGQDIDDVKAFGAEDSNRLFEAGWALGEAGEWWKNLPDWLITEELRVLQPVLPILEGDPGDSGR